VITIGVKTEFVDDAVVITLQTPAGEMPMPPIVARKVGIALIESAASAVRMAEATIALDSLGVPREVISQMLDRTGGTTIDESLIGGEDPFD